MRGARGRVERRTGKRAGIVPVLRRYPALAAWTAAFLFAESAALVARISPL